MGNRYRRKYKRIDEDDYSDRSTDGSESTQSAIQRFDSDNAESDSEDQASAVGAAARAIGSSIGKRVRSAAEHAANSRPSGGFTDENGDEVLTEEREAAIEETEQALAEAESRGFGETGRESVRDAAQEALGEVDGLSESDRESLEEDVEQLTAADRSLARYGSRGESGNTGSESGGGAAGGGGGAAGGGGGVTEASGGRTVGGAGGGVGQRMQARVGDDGDGGSGDGLDRENPYEGVGESTQDAIDQTPFTGETIDDARDAKSTYRASAGRMSRQTKNEQVAEDMFNHVGDGVRDNESRPSLYGSAGFDEDKAAMNVPENTDWQVASHEYGHLVADTYGYNDGMRGHQAAAAYADGIDRGEDDPFIQSDPNHSETKLSQANGEIVDDVPEEVDRLMQASNTGWSRIQEAYADPDDDHENYTVSTNYSATTSHEFLAQTSEYMQSDTPPEDDSFLKNQADVAWSYSQVFEPSDTMKSYMNEMHDDEDVDDPFPQRPYPDHEE